MPTTRRVAAGEGRKRLRVAAICSSYNPLQHADVIVTKFLKGMSTDDGFYPPEVDVTSIWIDCVLEPDIGLHLAKQHGVAVYPTIKQALECGTGAFAHAQTVCAHVPARSPRFALIPTRCHQAAWRWTQCCSSGNTGTVSVE